MVQPWQLALTLIGVGTVGTTVAADAYMRSEVFNSNSPIKRPPPKTTIVIPTLNEEAYILEVLASLENQNVKVAYPEKIETLLVDSGSEDQTIALAERYPVKIITAPKGKLTARHIGIMKAKGDVIVGVDADTYYPPNYLNLVLRYFHDSKVVGVTSPRLYGRDSNLILNGAVIWSNILEGISGRRMPGSNSTFTKKAYMQTGGFDLSINQFNAAEMVREEEYAFPDRLRKIGKLVREWKAPAYTSGRNALSRSKERSFREAEEFILLYPERRGV